jgi:two-component system response regulator MprA
MADLLIVDDDHDVAELLMLALGAEGHEIRVASDGHQGLERVSERRPDLALVDVEMPILTGPEMALAMFLRNCGDEKVPILLLSGVLGLGKVAAAVGTPYFLEKPYPLSAVIELILRALQERRAPNPYRLRQTG